MSIVRILSRGGIQIHGGFLRSMYDVALETGVYQWGKKREQATPRFLLPTFIHKFIYHPPTIHSRFTIYCRETKMKRSAFTKCWACLFGLLLFSTIVNNVRQKTTWSTRPLFMCLPSKPIKLWRVACSIRKFRFLKVKWDVLFISQYGGSAKFRSTRKFSKDRSRVLSIYTLLNFAAATAWLG